MCKEVREMKEVLNAHLTKMEEAFAHKELASSRLQKDMIDNQKKTTKKIDALTTTVDLNHEQQVNHQERTEALLKAWNNAQGFAKIMKWVAGVIVSIILFWQLVKPILIKALL